MFTFTQTINFYDDDRGFNVTYHPDDTRLSTISLWIRATPLADTDEMLRQLSKSSPQHEWQRQIDVLSVDTSVYQSLVGTELKVEQETASTTPINLFDLMTVQEIKSKII
jgi:hypothetical protein